MGGEQVELNFRPRESGYLEPGALGYSNATTSRDAAERVAPSAKAWREKIMQRLAALGAEGATADELVVFYGVQHNTIAPRLTELKSAGRIVHGGRRRPTRSGSLAIVWLAAAW